MIPPRDCAVDVTTIQEAMHLKDMNYTSNRGIQCTCSGAVKENLNDANFFSGS